MNQLKPEEIREIRAKAYRYRVCDEPEEHEWASLSGGAPPFLLDSPSIVLLILCRKCGRTPLEMLSELQFKEPL